MASYHIEGKALVSYQDFLEGALSRSLLIRFGPIAYDDPMKALTRLKHTSFVAAYKAQFEALSNRLRGLLDVHKLSCFLSRLKDEICLPIRMLNPINLNVAYGLAKIQEEYLLSTKRSRKIVVEKTSAFVGGSSSHSTYSVVYNKWQRSSIPTMKITFTQMDEKQRKGMCYHCDKKWSPAHNCKNPRIYLLQGKDELI